MRLNLPIKRLSINPALLCVILAFMGASQLHGQNNPSVNYDTVVLRESPCQVKKITLTADTAYKARFELRQDTIERYDTCRIKLNWPLVKGCKNARVDSFLNDTLKNLLKTELLTPIDTTNVLNLCSEGFALFKSDFEWFMNDRFLSVDRSIGFEIRYYNGLATIKNKTTKTRGHTSGFNYDLIAEQPLTFDNFFKEQYQDTLLNKLTESVIPQTLNKDNFVVTKDKIMFKPYTEKNSTSFNYKKDYIITEVFEKSKIKHYIKERYHGSE